MGIRIFYVFGALNPDGSPCVYDDQSNFNRYRFLLCDTLSDLNGREGDFAVVKDSNKFFFGEGSQWNEIIGEPGPQGEPGSVKDAWPIDSIFSCAVDTDPEILFGFGKWELLTKEPFYAWQRKE